MTPLNHHPDRGLVFFVLHFFSLLQEINSDAGMRRHRFFYTHNNSSSENQLQYLFSIAILTGVGGTVVLHSSRGNFLLQALLALAVVFAFVPFLTTRIAGREMDDKMYSATRQVETASTAARIFIRENARNIPYGTTVVAGEQFADLLEPYGLPLGFVPRTALGQNIAMVIDNADGEISAHLELRGGDLSALRRAELARRIGFYALSTEAGIDVGIALDTMYSDVVRRNEPDTDNNPFMTNLDMGNFSFDGAGRVYARTGDFETAVFSTLSLSGVENGRKTRSVIDSIVADKAVFQSADGAAALSLVRGTLSADSVRARTISRFGDTGSFSSRAASVYDFSMTAGRSGFTGPKIWNVRGNLVSNKINFTVDRIDIASYLNTARGQDVYIYTDELESSSKSGIEAAYLAASNITLRDQTSDALNRGEDGPVIIDIRPAGVSVLPDVLVSDIDNNAFKIIARASDDDGKTVDCKNIISAMGGVAYNQKSLAQNIICQYVFWQRLEHRINIKQCLMAGGGNCE